MFAQRWSYRTFLTATTCVTSALVLGGCPANNNNGQVASTQQANNTKTQVNLNEGMTPVTPEQVSRPTPPANANTNTNQATQQPSPYRSSSPLFEAVASKNAAKVEALLQAGEDPNEFIQDGQYGAYTVMHTAARLGEADIIRVLAKNGCKVNIRSVSAHGAMPLHWAARANHIDAVVALIEVGADVNAVAGVPGQPATPLKVAADRGFFEVANLIRAYGGKETPEGSTTNH